MEDKLRIILKKYVSIFVDEYKDFLSREKLELLRNIDYQKIIKLEDINTPFGDIIYDSIYLSKTSEDLISSLNNMKNYNTSRYHLSNKNLSSYFKYMCENGYNLFEYYSDILMYFVFKLVINDTSGFTNGLINQEIKYLSIKYSLRFANLYAREESIIAKITPMLNFKRTRKILFMDKVSRFKYLSEEVGYRYAELIDNVDSLINKEYEKLDKKEYEGLIGFLDYADMYDHLGYGDVYNYILDFEVENKLVN